MKIRLQDANSMGYLRCPLDDEVLLSFNGDDVTLQNCEHFHWHGSTDEVVENEKNENDEDNDEEEWSEILRDNYIAKVSVEDAVFYLIPVKKATEK